MSIANTESGQEVHEERTVEILAQLIENKPVSQLTAAEIALNFLNFVRSLEISVHPHVDQLEPETCKLDLKNSVDESKSSNDGEKEKPPPEDQEDLVVDHIETQNTDGVNVLLTSSRAPSPVVTRCNSRESVAHWVLHLPLFLLWQSVVEQDVWSVPSEPVVEEHVGQTELDEDNQPVEQFHSHETEEVDVVSGKKVAT